LRPYFITIFLGNLKKRRMKNLFFALSAFVVIGLSSCGSVDCDDTAAQTATGIEVSTAETAYAADASEDNCKDYKSALEELLDYSDCDGSTQADTDAVNALIDGLDC
jgi:hypothetical protein